MERGLSILLGFFIGCVLAWVIAVIDEEMKTANLFGYIILFVLLTQHLWMMCMFEARPALPRI